MRSQATRRTSAYDSNFEQRLIDYKIYPEGYRNRDDGEDPEPSNLESYRARLALPRASLSPSCFTLSNFKNFSKKNDLVYDEGGVMTEVFPIICGKANILSARNVPLTNLESMTEGTTVDAKPDLYDGARLTDIDRRVQKDIGEYIIPTAHLTAPVAPNFFFEAQGPDGSTRVVKRQACYDGAIGARAMHELQVYGQDEPVCDGEGYTTTATYHDGTLIIYTNYPTEAEDGTIEYHATRVGGWYTLHSPRTCREAFTAFRNSRDLATEKRNELISAANERAKAANVVAPPSNDNASSPTDVQDTTYTQEIEEGFAVDSQDYTWQEEPETSADEFELQV